KKDTGTGTGGTSNVYSSATHQHPLNIDPTTANVPLVNATAAANGTSDYYCRNDHVHPQQLTYDGNVTATKFIKTGGTVNDILLANGDTKVISDIAGDGFVAKTGKTLQSVQGVLRHSGDDEESEDDEDYVTRGYLYNQYVSKASPDTITAGTPLYINYRGSSLSTQYPNSKLVQKYVLNAGSSTSFAGVTCGVIQINPMTNNFDDGLRIARQVESTGSAAIQLGCSRTTNIGQIAGQWAIHTSPSNHVNNPLGFKITLASDSGDNTRGLQISADGNTLSFNGTVIAGTGATNGGDSSVTYSQGKAVQWGINSSQSGGLYASGQNLYWNART
ncbi:MAG: hypothetical protein EZS28_048896, partial [Streblomastix strix]